jgi:hypothetical protein
MSIATHPFRGTPPAFALAGVFLLFVLAAASSRAHPGWGIAMDSRGVVYFADVGRETVWKLAPDGELSAAATGVWTHEILIDAADNVYFEDEDYVGPPVMVGTPPRLEEAGTRTITFYKLAPDGELSAIVPPTPSIYPGGERPVVLDNFANGLTLLRDNAGDSWGFVYEPDSEFPKLVRRSPGTLEGETIVAQESVWTREAPESEREPFQPGGIQSASWGRANGDIILTASGAVWRVSPATGQASRLGSPPPKSRPDEPGYIRVMRAIDAVEDSNGNIYVANCHKRRVEKLGAEKGVEVEVIYESQSAWAPLGVEPLADGGLLILETRPMNSPLALLGGDAPLRVIRLDAKGETTTLAEVTDAKLRARSVASNRPANQK